MIKALGLMLNSLFYDLSLLRKRTECQNATEGQIILLISIVLAKLSPFIKGDEVRSAGGGRELRIAIRRGYCPQIK